MILLDDQVVFYQLVWSIVIQTSLLKVSTWSEKKKKKCSSQKSSVKGSNSGVDVERFLTTASDFSTVSVSIKAELMHSLTLLCVLCNQENVTLPCSSCVLILECLSAIKYCTLVLFCCIRLWISVAQTACLSAKERQSTDWWVLCVCAGVFVCELVVFLLDLISSYPPPTPPQHAVNRVSATRWEMAQLSPAGEIWARMHHCFFPDRMCVFACVCVREWERESGRDNMWMCAPNIQSVSVFTLLYYCEVKSAQESLHTEVVLQ